MQECKEKRFQIFFDTFKEHTACNNLQFIINHQKVLINYLDCNTTLFFENMSFPILNLNNY
jgi:hydrogenase nickel incorporation protein HypA/HybF